MSWLLLWEFRTVAEGDDRGKWRWSEFWGIFRGNFFCPPFCPYGAWLPISVFRGGNRGEIGWGRERREEEWENSGVCFDFDSFLLFFFFIQLKI